MEKIAELFVTWQIQKNVIKEEDRAVYIYAYETLLMRVINLLIAIIVGVSVKNLTTVLIFLASYIPLRTYAGGYHSRDSIRCMIFSTLLILCVALVTKTPRFEESTLRYFIFVGISILSYVVILFASPVADKNKPLSEEEKKKCAILARMIATLVIIAALIFYLFKKPEVVGVLLMGQVIMALMLILGIINNWRLDKMNY